MKYLKNAVHSMKELPVSLRAALSNRSGEGYVDTAVKILMAVVIGALVLAGPVCAVWRCGHAHPDGANPGDV